MIDDIVTRLREQCFCTKDTWCSDACIAADEIESLRAIIKWLEHTQTCPNYGKKQCWECVSPANQKSIMGMMFTDGL